CACSWLWRVRGPAGLPWAERIPIRPEFRPAFFAVWPWCLIPGLARAQPFAESIDCMRGAGWGFGVIYDKTRSCRNLGRVTGGGAGTSPLSDSGVSLAYFGAISQA